MTLTNPRIGYVTIRDKILSMLRNAKSTLNTNLTTGSTFTADTQIIAGDIGKVPSYTSGYPVIMVQAINKDEDFTNLGNAGRKYPVVTFRIYAVIRIVDSYATKDEEILHLTDNIESIFRDNIDMDNVVLYSQPTATEFANGNLDGVYTEAVSIDLVCQTKVE